MRCKLPAHLYIRVDKDLRSALNAGARASGENVSAFARRALREAIGQPDRDPPPTAPAGPAAQMSAAA